MDIFEKIPPAGEISYDSPLEYRNDRLIKLKRTKEADPKGYPLDDSEIQELVDLEIRVRFGHRSSFSTQEETRFVELSEKISNYLTEMFPKKGT